MGWLWPRRVLFGHNPDYYDTATMGPYWRTVTDAAVTAGGGYGGAGAIIFDTGAGTTAGTQTMTPSTPSVIAFPEDYGQPRAGTDAYHFFAGSRVYIDALPGSSTPIYAVLNANGIAQVSLCVNASGYYEVYRSIPGNGDAALLWDSSTVGVTVTPATFQRTLFMGSIHHYPSGWFEIWLDSTNVIYISGFDTFVEEPLPAQGFAWCGLDDWKHSHMFYGDGVPEYADPLRRGGFMAQSLAITADGTYDDLTANTGNAHDAVDDTTPDDDTTYIGGDTAGQASSFEHAALGVTRIVYGASVTARYDGTARPGVVMNGGKYLPGIALTTPVDTWAVAREVIRTNPATGLPWSRTTINLAEVLVGTL